MERSDCFIQKKKSFIFLLFYDRPRVWSDGLGYDVFFKHFDWTRVWNRGPGNGLFFLSLKSGLGVGINSIALLSYRCFGPRFHFLSVLDQAIEVCFFWIRLWSRCQRHGLFAFFWIRLSFFVMLEVNVYI